jgi:hypothetical protein
VAHAVHQRLMAAACVQKQLAQQAAEFKRRFGRSSSQCATACTVAVHVHAAARVIVCELRQECIVIYMHCYACVSRQCSTSGA